MLPEAKTDVAWMGADRVLVASPLGGAEFATQSGYARTVRLWRRGTLLHRGADRVRRRARSTSASVSCWQLATTAPRPSAPSFMRGARLHQFQGVWSRSEPGGQRRRIEVPTECPSISCSRDWLMVDAAHRLDGRREDPASGRRAAGDAAFAAFMAGERHFPVLFAPSERAFLPGAFDGPATTSTFSVLDDVRSRVMLGRPRRRGLGRSSRSRDSLEQAVVDIKDASTRTSAIPVAPARGTAGEFTWSTSNNAVTPMTDVAGALRRKAAAEHQGGAGTLVRRARGLSDRPAPLRKTDDGARIPYFQIGRADLARDGGNAALLSGYGGFEIALLPYYAGISGKLWHRKGTAGPKVVANIRGGGEFGPACHIAGMRAGKKTAHDDSRRNGGARPASRAA